MTAVSSSGLPSLLISVLWTDCSHNGGGTALSSGGIAAVRSPSDKKRSLALPPPEAIQLSEECLVTTLLIVKVLNNIARLDLALVQVCWFGLVAAPAAVMCCFVGVVRMG
jgi:hypothetical protein